MRARLIAVLLLLGAPAFALTVHVNGNAEVIAQLRRVDAQEAVREVLLKAGAANDVAVGEGMWEVTAVSSDVWAAPVHASASETVMLTVWPRAELRGTIRKGPASGELSLHFSSEALSGVSTCELKERQWRCALPAGTFDIRLALAGFANEFRWGVTAPADLKEIDFTPGSSLGGYVEGARDASLEVVAAQQAKTFTAKPNARGFFQIKGLAPGEYTVRARAKELVSEVRTVQIIGHTNATLKEPLVVAKPSTLTVTLMPQLDPRNQPWRIELSRQRAGERFLDIVTSSNASADGAWSARGLTPGDYHVAIAQQDGSQWKSESVIVSSEDAALHVFVPGERVAGTIALGDEPIAATLRFGGERGQAIVASENGQFSGVIAPPGDEASLIEVTAEDAKLHRTVKVRGRVDAEGVRRYDIRLGAVMVSGIVRNEDGSPATDAIVTLDDVESDAFEQTYAEDDGAFAFAGFEPGTYRLSAQNFATRSDIVEVKVTETSNDELVLVLRPRVTIHGRVAMGSVPVTGATVFGIPRGVPIQVGPQARSDLSGKFTLQLPPGTETYDIAVIPRGFYVSIGRMQVAHDKIVRAEIAQDGGALHVDAPAGQHVRLLHAGADFSLEMLARASEGTVEKTADGQKLGIGNLEPGMYSVCGEKKCVTAYVARWGKAEVSLR